MCIRDRWDTAYYSNDEGNILSPTRSIATTTYNKFVPSYPYKTDIVSRYLTDSIDDEKLDRLTVNDPANFGIYQALSFKTDSHCLTAWLPTKLHTIDLSRLMRKADLHLESNYNFELSPSKYNFERAEIHCEQPQDIIISSVHMTVFDSGKDMESRH
eukprot:TRINITY_DN6067_c0_g1_i2.p2 TRINITY_DN6067_c0_g1~~TRINITY_DN6067_c0_g1_i2.p2  ORF type:complete len:157 (-),score=27.34 TRINITY_DN6067_c0_g1_i2:858-1328(-)